MGEAENEVWVGRPSQVSKLGLYILRGLTSFLVLPLLYAVWRWIEIRCRRYEWTSSRPSVLAMDLPDNLIRLPLAILLAACLAASAAGEEAGPRLVAPERVSDFELPRAVRLEVPEGTAGTVLWQVGRRSSPPEAVDGRTEIPLAQGLRATPSGTKHTLRVTLSDVEGRTLFRDEREVVAFQELPHSHPLGVFYFPARDPAGELPRMARGDWGGRAGFSHVLHPAVEPPGGAEARVVGPSQLADLARHGGGAIRAVVDVHTLANGPSLAGEPSAAEKAIAAIAAGPNSDLIAGWYVCDEPFAHCRPGQPPHVDIRDIWDLVNLIRRVAPGQGCRAAVWADYGSLAPLLRKGGDLVNGNRGHFTRKARDREGFWWGGEWVFSVQDPAYHGGRPIYRRYGAFAEEATLINFYGDGRSLRSWLRDIESDVPLSRVQIVTFYDWSEDTPVNNQGMLERVEDIFRVGDRAGIAGYWLWPWARIPVTSQGKTYKGVSCWWESDPTDPKYPRRYAHLIEGVE